MSDHSIYEQVYENLMESLPQYDRPGPWNRFTREDDLRRPSNDPETVLENLRKQFSADDLVRTGVAELTDDGVLTLARSLCDCEEVILVLRGPEGNVPFDFMLNGGCLSQRMLPICALLGDRRMRRFFAERGRPLCVTFSMADAAMLLRAGFPSAVAAGLSPAKGDDLEMLRRCFQLDAHDERPSNADFLLTQEPGEPGCLLADVLQDPEFRPPEVRVVAWSVDQLNLSQPEELPALIDHFVNLEQYMGFSFEDFRLWRPSQDDVDRIRFCLEHGCLGDVQNALLQSLDESTSELICSMPTRPTKNLREAFGHFRSLLCQPDGSKVQENLAWQDCEQAVQRELIDRLVERATAMDDPVERTYCLTAANVAQLAHAQGMALKSAMMRQARKSSGVSVSPLNREDVQTLMAMTDRLLQLGKEIQKCGAQSIWTPSK